MHHASVGRRLREGGLPDLNLGVPQHERSQRADAGAESVGLRRPPGVHVAEYLLQPLVEVEDRTPALAHVRKLERQEAVALQRHLLVVREVKELWLHIAEPLQLALLHHDLCQLDQLLVERGCEDVALRKDLCMLPGEGACRLRRQRAYAGGKRAFAHPSAKRLFVPIEKGNREVVNACDLAVQRSRFFRQGGGAALPVEERRGAVHLR
mmetsp:Transcript_28994/g.72303  ORF Transcript_28994/g.72303 Transcript_28994/m.72303 type:complete len:209 (-) Transcript_28994:858-1484(-)